MNQDKENFPSSALNVSRRHFVTLTGAATAGWLLGSRTLPVRAGETPASTGSPILKGFIVSDAHFGWISPQQPSVQEQAAAMRHLTERFPDLDVFLDTGDGHHNNAKDSDYGDWTDVVVRGCGPLPMFFTMGNHEFDAYNYDWDPEDKTARMGSVGCRPYYSFDVKGVHFLVLPQLMMVNYVTRESLNWAALDLELNKDKTTVVLSHNSLKGTTEPLTKKSDLAYREVVNSDDVYDVINRQNNVIAWMHGHNHDYRIVPKPERVYVSNGRFGGFHPAIEGAPPEVNTRPHVGGIYFEVHSDRFIVRCYSATAGKFFDEMPGCAHLSHERQGVTSLQTSSPFRLSYGHGNVLDGMRQPLYQYHAGTASRELYFTALGDAVLNDNTSFSDYAERLQGERLMPAYELRSAGTKEHQEGTASENVYTWNNPGITLNAYTNPTDTLVFGAPGTLRGIRCYYRVAPGQELGARVQFGKVAGHASLTPRLHVASNDQQVRSTLEAPVTVLKTDGQTVSFDFHIPKDIASGTIYADPVKDLLLNAWVELSITNLTSPVEVKKFEIFAKNRATKEGTVLIVNGEAHEITPGAAEKPVTLKSAASEKEWVETRLGDATRGIFLIRESPLWQARNAPMFMRDGALHIGELRNDFSSKRDVILAPVQPLDEPYVHRLGGLAPAVVHLYDAISKKLSVTVDKITTFGEIECVCSRKPSRVTGASSTNWVFDKNRLLIRVVTPETITAEWA